MKKDMRPERERPDRAVMMTKTPVPELVTKLAIPTIISMLVTGIYNTADTYFVGGIGDSSSATAAICRASKRRSQRQVSRKKPLSPSRIAYRSKV